MKNKNKSIIIIAESLKAAVRAPISMKSSYLTSNIDFKSL